MAEAEAWTVTGDEAESPISSVYLMRPSIQESKECVFKSLSSIFEDSGNPGEVNNRYSGPQI